MKARTHGERLRRPVRCYYTVWMSCPDKSTEGVVLIAQTWRSASRSIISTEAAMKLLTMKLAAHTFATFGGYQSSYSQTYTCVQPELHVCFLTKHLF